MAKDADRSGEDEKRRAVIRDRLNAALAAKAMTQSDLAQATALSRDSIARYFMKSASGSAPPDRKLIIIASALGVKPSFIDPSRPDLDEVQIQYATPSDDTYVTRRPDDDPKFTWLEVKVKLLNEDARRLSDELFDAQIVSKVREIGQ